MREILFRGKSLKTGKWTQGYLFRCWERAYILWGMVNDNPDMVEVDPETVCQYTGLADKNGKKIFEGDIIVAIYKKHREEWDCGVVKYGEFNCSCCYGVYGWYFENEDIRDYELYEVRGNIFDNPELIGK